MLPYQHGLRNDLRAFGKVLPSSHLNVVDGIYLGPEFGNVCVTVDACSDAQSFVTVVQRTGEGNVRLAFKLFGVMVHCPSSVVMGKFAITRV